MSHVYVALLHSIVLGGGRRVVMEDLRALAGDIGFLNPRTLVSTGNLVFETRQEMTVQDAERQLEQGIVRVFGKPIDVIVRTAGDWTEMARGNPFPRESEEDGSRVLVRVMRQTLDESIGKKLEPYLTEPERLNVVSGDLWISFATQPSKTRLLSQLTAKKLGVGTLRNWNTVRSLTEMLK